MIVFRYSLIKTDKTIMEITLETGYCDSYRLSSQFKNKTGINLYKIQALLKKIKPISFFNNIIKI